MSNRSQTQRDHASQGPVRGKQPEWNAPLVSLPDISQIINGDVEINQPVSVSISGQNSTQSSPAPASTQDDKAEFQPVLIPENNSVDTKSESDESQEQMIRPTARRKTPTPITHKPTVAEPTVPATPDAGASAPATKLGAEESDESTTAEKSADDDLLKRRWKNLLICAGSIAATIAILSAFGGGDREPSDDVAQTERAPLHDEPLDASSTNAVPVVELASEPESQPEKNNSDVSPNEKPEEQPSSDDGSQLNSAVENGFDLAMPLNDASDQALPTAPPNAIPLNSESVSQASIADTDGTNSSKSVDEPNGDFANGEQYRDIQRYQPAERSFIQPPNQTSQTAPPASNPHNNLPQGYSQSVEDARPYYERTSPERYQWPEGANARAIEFLSRRVRR